MIKQAIQFISATILGFGLVAGCGATQDDASDDTSGLNGAPFVDPMGPTLGQAEEAISSPISVKSSQTASVGIVQFPANTQCTPSTAGQLCNLPASKTWVVCTVSVSQPLQQTIVSVTAEMRLNSGFNIGASTLSSCATTNPHTIIALNSALAGPADANIANYELAQFIGTGHSLTTSTDAPMLSRDNAALIVDESKLTSLGGTVGVQNNRRFQAVARGLAQMIGLGATGCGSVTPHPITCGGFADGETVRHLLPVQTCLTSAYSVANPTVFTLTGQNCGQWPSGV